MKCYELQDQLIELFYGEADAATQKMAEEHRANCKACEQSWQSLNQVKAKFSEWPDVSVPPHLIALIREQSRMNHQVSLAAKSKSWKRPVFAACASVLLAAFGFYLGGQFGVTDSSLQFSNSTATLGMSQSNQILLNRPSPMINNQPQLTAPFYNKHLVYPSLSNVSLGKQGVLGGSQASFGSTRYNFDDVLDQKILSGNLDSNDLLAIYFRARNLEKLEYYQEALKDYEFLDRFGANFEDIKAVKLAVARCLIHVGEKDQAAEYLGSLFKKYPTEVKPMIDQLKSETL